MFKINSLGMAPSKPVSNKGVFLKGQKIKAVVILDDTGKREQWEIRTSTNVEKSMTEIISVEVGILLSEIPDNIKVILDGRKHANMKPDDYLDVGYDEVQFDIPDDLILGIINNTRRGVNFTEDQKKKFILEETNILNDDFHQYLEDYFGDYADEFEY